MEFRDIERLRLLGNVRLKPRDGKLADLKELLVHAAGYRDSRDMQRFVLERVETEDRVWGTSESISVLASIDGVDLSLVNKDGETACRMRLDFTSASGQSASSSQRSNGAVSRELVTEHGTQVGISFTEKIVIAAEPAAFFTRMGCLKYEDFQITQDLSDLTNAISLQQQALEMTPNDHPDLAQRLGNLAVSLYTRFKCTGNLPDLNESIVMGQKTLAMTPNGHPQLPARLGNLNAAFYARFERTGTLSDLNEVIGLGQQALEMTTSDHPGLALRLGNLTASLYMRFERCGELSDLNKAIDLGHRLLEMTPSTDPDLPRRLTILVTCYHTRFRRTGELPNLNRAISLEQRTLEKIPDGHPDSPARLSNLGVLYHARFERTGDLPDVSKAISIVKQALKMTPDGHPDLPLRMTYLGAFVHARFERTRNLPDLDEAIGVGRKVLDIIPNDHTNLPQWVNNLASALHARFENAGALPDLDEAISLKKKALNILPEGHPDHPTMLANLGTSIHVRFKRTGELVYLHEAISLYQKGLELTPSYHPDLPKRLASLGSCVHLRFEHTGELADIDEAISLKQKALEITPNDHPNLPSMLDTLATSVHARLQRTGRLADLDRAICLCQKAIDMTPKDHPDLPLRLGNLGTYYRSRSERTGKLSDLNKAISLTREALKETPDGHSGLALRCSSLGNALYARLEHTADLDDLNETVLLDQRALELTPDGHPAEVARLHSLAIALSTKDSLFGSSTGILEAIPHLKSAATSSVGSYADRLRASRDWVRCLQQLYGAYSPDLILAFETTLRLCELVVGLDHTVSHRYSTLQNVSGVAVEACSAALSRRRVDKALEWLEQGRCLVWGQLSQLRTPIDELRVRHSALADRITALSREIDAAGASRIHSHYGRTSTEKMSLETEARKHQELVKDRDELIAQARKLPGFETFLLPPSYSSLLSNLPPAGYVVVISVHKTRCDAIVLSSQWKEPRHVWLENFSLEKAQHYRVVLREGCEHRGFRMDDFESEDRGARLRRERVETPTAAVFKGLWLDVVKPIFDVLELKKIDPLSRTGQAYPRIWWCPTGVLSFLPLHAAGVYDEGKEGLSAFDYAISSYTPTITALTNRVKHGRPVSKGISGLLMTSQPSPRCTVAPTILGTTKEVQSVYSRACEEKVRTLKVEGDAVTVGAYLEQMEQFSSVHLACHGSQRADDPLASRFLFHNGSLELRAIIKKNLDNADLAFLSACQTSTGDEKLADEAVHLAAGMLAAGYRRVVATMWPISDREAPRVAQDFYEYIFDRREEGDMGGFDGSLSAEALHDAIQRLRSRLGDSEKSLLTWAPYVHWGY